MGNLIGNKNEIICCECKKINLKPQYFTKNILSNHRNILIDTIDIYDNFGNKIIPIPIQKQKDIIEYTCSNNHTFIHVIK